MIRALLELIRIVAYGGLGILVGYIVGCRASDDHELKASILNPSGDTVSESGRPRWLNQSALVTAAIVLCMVALLGTGVAILVNNRANDRQDAEDAAQRARLCEAVSELTDTLNTRTKATREAARVNDELWRGIRHLVIKFSEKPNNPLLDRIDVYLNKRRDLVAEQKANPYNTVKLKDCDG